MLGLTEPWGSTRRIPQAIAIKYAEFEGCHDFLGQRSLSYPRRDETLRCSRDKRRRQIRRHPAEASPAFSGASISEASVGAYCFRLREGIAATAVIMTLAAIIASSRTMSGGIPMLSRAIRASSNAVATAAVNSRITSTNRIILVKRYHDHSDDPSGVGTKPIICSVGVTDAPHSRIKAFTLKEKRCAATQCTRGSVSNEK
jgi:hypothetical protein